MNARQTRVIALMAQGHTLAYIGRQMYVAERTVKSYLQQAMREVGAVNRPHLVAIAIRKGLIDNG